MRILITGCNGLVGSAVTDLFCQAGHEVVGIDNDSRRLFFGQAGSTLAVAKRLLSCYGRDRLHLFNTDIRNDLTWIFKLHQFDAIVHCAAQPSHDWAAEHPIEDFDINASATVQLLETCRQHCPEAVFVLMSTNKIYGAELSGVQVVEHETRMDFSGLEYGIDESFSVDQCTRSLYGVGKLAADAAAQEYGRYYGMRTVCLRAGCITGAGHAAVSLHGFLSYVVKCNLTSTEYVVKGYGGKQVRDNIHAVDLAELIGRIVDRPPASGSVYNVGGGKANSCSILEAFAAVEELTGTLMLFQHDPVARIGDHACYYTDLRKVMMAYDWQPRFTLTHIYENLVADWSAR
jgi:CDP-paratose 2-epimerase